MRDEQTEAPKGKATCPRSHSKSVAKVRSEVSTRFSGFPFRAHPTAPYRCPNPGGTFIYRIPLAKREVPEFSSSPLHSGTSVARSWMSTESGIGGKSSSEQGAQCPQPWSRTSVECLLLRPLSHGPASWASVPPEGSCPPHPGWSLAAVPSLSLAAGEQCRQPAGQSPHK